MINPKISISVRGRLYIHYNDSNCSSSVHFQHQLLCQAIWAHRSGENCQILAGNAAHRLHSAADTQDPHLLREWSRCECFTWRCNRDVGKSISKWCRKILQCLIRKISLYLKKKLSFSEEPRVASLMGSAKLPFEINF